MIACVLLFLLFNDVLFVVIICLNSRNTEVIVEKFFSFSVSIESSLCKKATIISKVWCFSKLLRRISFVFFTYSIACTHTKHREVMCMCIIFFLFFVVSYLQKHVINLKFSWRRKCEIETVAIVQQIYRENSWIYYIDMNVTIHIYDQLCCILSSLAYINKLYDRLHFSSSSF